MVSFFSKKWKVVSAIILSFTLLTGSIAPAQAAFPTHKLSKHWGSVKVAKSSYGLFNWFLGVPLYQPWWNWWFYYRYQMLTPVPQYMYGGAVNWWPAVIAVGPYLNYSIQVTGGVGMVNAIRGSIPFGSVSACAVGMVALAPTVSPTMLQTVIGEYNTVTRHTAYCGPDGTLYEDLAFVTPVGA